MTGERGPILLVDLTLLEGMSFHFKTHVVAEIIDGNVVDLSNHQTELHESYKKKHGIN